MISYCGAQTPIITDFAQFSKLATSSINAWYTAVWVKQKGRWRLVASQLTDIPPQKSQ